MSDSPVIIVGAGLAGLSCAVRLHASGIPCRVFEKNDKVGGRVSTESHNGFLLDRGFQVLLTAYSEARDVLDYDSLDLGRFEPGALIRFDGKFHRFADPWRRPSSLVSTALSPIGSLADKLKVARLRRHVCRGSLDDVFNRPEMTTDEALRSFGFSDQIVERFFRPFFGGVFLERELKTSSRKFEFVFRMFSEGDAALPVHGMTAIAQQLCNRLPEGTVQTRTSVSSVDGQKVVLADGTEVAGRSVVVACDKASSQQLLGNPCTPDGHRVACLYYSADEPPIEEPILVLNGEGKGPINNLCVPSQVVKSYAPHGKSLISVTSLAVKGTSGDALESRVRDQLKSWFGSRVDTWEHLKTFHLENALPQQSPPALTPVAKAVKRSDGVYVCGDHLDIASIQGALATGRRVAESLVESTPRT